MARVFAFPRSGSPYTECLYRKLEALGAEVIEGEWSGSRLLTAIRQNDVIHVHWPSFLYYSKESHLRTSINALRMRVILDLARRKGARIVWTAHNLYPHDGGRNYWLHRAMRRYVVRIAERIFVHAPTAGEIVKQEFGLDPRRIELIQHGHWIDYYPAGMPRVQARERLGLDAASYVYTFVGICKPYKNLEALLDAFHALRQPNALLVIAGAFQSDEYLARIRRKLEPLGARVRFEPRYLTNDELPLYLSAADAMVLPYSEVLTSGTAMLAMSFGRPVIAPDVGGLKDVIDVRSGVLYDMQESDALARAMQEVRARQYDEREIIARARSLDWDVAARAVLNFAMRVARSG